MRDEPNPFNLMAFSLKVILSIVAATTLIRGFRLIFVLMKALTCSCFFLLLLFGNSYSQGFKQTLVISNLHNKTGTLYIGWYKKAEDFRKADHSVLQQKAETGGKESVAVVFENVSPGTYAIAVFLDENANGKIDTNFLGIPKEKYGFSNNVFPMMRAASFKESAFSVGGKDQIITIRLK